MSFVGKVVLITGASSGIGAATAIHLAQLGASLSITGRNEQYLDKVAEQCDQHKPFIITGDLINENDVKNIIDSTIEHYGKLDVLVNNEGILKKGGTETTILELYDRVNVFLVQKMIVLAMPHLIKTKGNIINVSSVAESSRSCTSYCMSKLIINQLTRCVALNLIPKQVRVNAVNPGFIETDLHSGLSDEELKKFYDDSRYTNALGRTVDVWKVAKTIAFLASADASCITGATLPVDGGRHAMCSH